MAPRTPLRWPAASVDSDSESDTGLSARQGRVAGDARRFQQANSSSVSKPSSDKPLGGFDDSLLQLGAAPSVIAALLIHRNPAVRMKAAVALGQLGEGSVEFVPLLEEKLFYDPCRAVRDKAALALVLMGRNPGRRWHGLPGGPS